MSDTESTPEASGGVSFRTQTFRDQVSQIRTTAKWLVATFGALGAALVGSLQLAGLEATSGTDRATAVIGFVLGLLGASIVVVLMGQVLASVPRNPKAGKLEHEDVIAAAESRGAWVLGGYKDGKHLEEAWQSATERRQSAYEEYLKARDEEPKNEQGAQKAFREHEAAAYRADMALDVVHRLHTFAELHEVRRQFESAVKGMVAGIVLAGVGVVLFATTVAASDEQRNGSASDSAVAMRSLPAMLRVDEDAHDRYQEAFGSTCNLDAVEVIILGMQEGAYELVVLPGSGCEPMRARIPESDGFVFGADIEIEAPNDGPSVTEPEEDNTRSPVGEN
jgi:hypothetical protein